MKTLYSQSNGWKPHQLVPRSVEEDDIQATMHPQHQDPFQQTQTTPTPQCRVMTKQECLGGYSRRCVVPPIMMMMTNGQPTPQCVTPPSLPATIAKTRTTTRMTTTTAATSMSPLVMMMNDKTAVPRMVVARSTHTARSTASTVVENSPSASFSTSSSTSSSSRFTGGDDDDCEEEDFPCASFDIEDWNASCALYALSCDERLPSSDDDGDDNYDPTETGDEQARTDEHARGMNNETLAQLPTPKKRFSNGAVYQVVSGHGKTPAVLSQEVDNNKEDKEEVAIESAAPASKKQRNIPKQNMSTELQHQLPCIHNAPPPPSTLRNLPSKKRKITCSNRNENILVNNGRNPATTNIEGGPVEANTENNGKEAPVAASKCTPDSASRRGGRILSKGKSARTNAKSATPWTKASYLTGKTTILPQQGHNRRGVVAPDGKKKETVTPSQAHLLPQSLYRVPHQEEPSPPTGPAKNTSSDNEEVPAFLQDVDPYHIQEPHIPPGMLDEDDSNFTLISYHELNPNDGTFPCPLVSCFIVPQVIFLVRPKANLHMLLSLQIQS